MLFESTLQMKMHDLKSQVPSSNTRSLIECGYYLSFPYNPNHSPVISCGQVQRATKGPVLRAVSSCSLILLKLFKCAKESGRVLCTRESTITIDKEVGDAANSTTGIFLCFSFHLCLKRCVIERNSGLLLIKTNLLSSQHEVGNIRI